MKTALKIERAKRIAGMFGKLLLSPSLLVLLLVLFLLGGWQGTCRGIAELGRTFANCFIGGGPREIAEVVWRTLPLTAGVALMTFGFSRGWLRCNAMGIVACAVVILGCGFLGEALQHGSQVTMFADWLQRGEDVTPPAAQATTKLSAARPPISGPPALSISTSMVSSASSPSLEAVAESGQHDPATRSNWIGASARLPNTGGVIGLVCRAINQLLDYLEMYQPRLFAASLIVGVYLGWFWNQQVNRVEKRTRDEA